ncbi:MAG: ABC transporter permease [Thermoguttaceae bacterium]
MNRHRRKACGHILWREGAEQYAFCISVFVLLIVLQASLTTMATFDMIPEPDMAFGLSMALFMTAIYAAASSVLLFTAEVDAGKFSFHRTRPIDWLTYLKGKLGWTVLSSILLGVAAWLETCIWQGAFPNARDGWLAMGVSGVGIVEGLAWGLVASMLFRDPLRGVVGGIAMASAGAYAMVLVHHRVTGSGTVSVTTAYNDAAWPRLILAATVLAGAIPLVRTWYRTGRPLRPWALPRLLRGDATLVATAGDWTACGEPRRGRAIRLLWQSWRQMRPAALVYWGLCAAALTCLGLDYFSKQGRLPQDVEGYLAWVALTVVALSPSLAGYTFGPDQKARFLHLARDGVTPWEIWLSRLAVMGAILLPPALVVLSVLWYGLPDESERVLARQLILRLVVLGYASVLVVGQACSMFVRSRIVAAIMSPVVVACLACWVGLGVFYLGLGWGLGVTPILLALLFGSRLLAGTRLRQDNSWRAMRVPALIVAASLVFVFLAFAHHRATEIRPYDSAYARNDKLVAGLAARLVAGPPRRIVKIAESRIPKKLKARDVSPRERIEQALQGEKDGASGMLAGVLWDVWRENSDTILSPSKVGRARTYAAMLLADADLDRTLREVVKERKTDNNQLRVCIDFLEDWVTERSRQADWLAADWARDTAWLQYGPVEGYDGYGFHDEPLPWQFRWLPFERTRALRLLDRTCRIAAERAEIRELAVIDDQAGVEWAGLYLTGGSMPVLTGQDPLLGSGDLVPYDPSRPIWYQAFSQMPLQVSGLERFRLIDSVATFSWSLSDPLFTAESQRRGTILYLALRMYYNDQGRLPKSLDALVAEGYLAELPVVPIARKPFRYEPSAASDDLNLAIGRHKAYAAVMFPASDTDMSLLLTHDPSLPFLWHPLGPRQEMDPGAGPGMCIDLDFVK